MNIYQKLNASRTTLQKSKLAKSGHNKFAGYQYFELGDFLPAINSSFEQLGLFSQVSFSADLATLTITDCDKPEDKIVFTSPMAEASLKGVHPIQNLGAVETYQRRYLYMMALEIVEHDALDASEPVKKNVDSMISGAKTIADLGKVWKSLNESEQHEYQEKFTARKLALTPKEAA